jgi:hypothetical protein
LQLPLLQLDLFGCPNITKKDNFLIPIPIIGYYFQQSQFLGKTIPLSAFSLKKPEQLHRIIIEYLESPELHDKLHAQFIDGF